MRGKESWHKLHWRWSKITALIASEVKEAAQQGDMQKMLQVLVEAERCAIRVYIDICNMSFGKDQRTDELSLAILNEEIEHEACFSEFLGEGPSGHIRRGSPGDLLTLHASSLRPIHTRIRKNGSVCSSRQGR